MLEKGCRSVTAASAPTRFVVRVLLAAVFVGACLWTLPAGVSAQTASPDAAAPLSDAAAAAGVDGSVDLITLIGRIVNIVFGFLGVILLGYILYAGYLWMTAGGDPKQIQQAKDTIRNAIIGLAIFVSSFAIVTFLLRQFGGLGQSDGFFGGGGGDGSVSLSGFPDRAGALGDSLRDVYPMPGARDVARNTAIMVTFAEPIKINSFVHDYDDRGTPENLDDDVSTSTRIGLNTDNIRIYRTSEGRTRALTSDQVRVRFTPDRLTFVLRPVNYLGSSAESQDYTVELAGGPTGVRLENGQPVFSGRRSNGYRWAFQVSTNVDMTPPKIVSAIPASGGRFAPNIVVQVNFNEPVDPTSAAGIVRDGGAGFNNIELAARPLAGGASVRPSGEFRVSNAYSTVEFVANLACGVNSCGRQIFCLPADSAIRVDVKAATLEAASSSQAMIVRGLYDGVVDTAGNSLDGNANDRAQGPPTDTYSYSFTTLTTPDRSPPFVRGFSPAPDTGLIPVDQTPSADFNSLLQSSTVHSGNITLLTNEPASDTFWFRPRMVNLVGNRPAIFGENASSSRALIDHRVYAAATARFSPEYYPSLGSGVQNIYQNCFNPTGSDNTTAECRGTADRPNCCFIGGVATPSATACPYPTTPRP